MFELKALLEQFLSFANAPHHLFEVTDWGVLKTMLRNAESEHTRILIEWRMTQVVSTITDLNILIELQEQSPSESVSHIIERQMANVLPAHLPIIIRWEDIVRIRKHVPAGSIAEHLVEHHMRKLLPTILPTITDWGTLIKMWKCTPNNTPAERMVEERMFEVIFLISADNVPEWFIGYLRNPAGIPSPHFAVAITEKARFLLIDL